MKKPRFNKRLMKKESKKVIAALDKRVDTGIFTKEILFSKVYQYRIRDGYQVIACKYAPILSEHRINSFIVCQHMVMASTNLMNANGKVLVRKTEDIVIYKRGQVCIRPIPFVYNT